MKKTYFVVTIIGPDKRGLVADVTETILENDASIEESHMMRLGGEFAMMMLIALPKGQYEKCCQNLEKFKEEGLEVFSRETDLARLEKFQGFVPYEISVWGADHAGIIHAVADYLSEAHVQVEDIETHVTKAPLSGAPLFSMNAMVQVPPDLALPEFREELEDLGDELGVDIDVKMRMD
ncbi:MAG: transcriptional regulator [Anaerolineae bacterium]|jgi:glycine cleavage system transcriptional repressor|nr:transcriptional regulator [Anaerolineae bacterium]MBT3714885.1 transcriptional regulator [Anaerolineae bacterium]MBT4309036.1 transcriptional regulator [Anaerolineae bacterium]MBT4457895.1 transcriptional regulator [Anaerolineae bacterium]MBT4842084.1 transcriptional regulator [Anaerolineae bacterium]